MVAYVLNPQSQFPLKTLSLYRFKVTAQLPGENGYTGGKVIFIDSENTLYPS